MAMSSLRLRRALSISSSILKHQRLSYSVHSTSISPSISSLTAEPQNSKLDLTQPRTNSFDCQYRNFRSTSISLSSSRRPYANNNEEEIGPDTVLFEGCDYNHWLITMDFPKDPAPTREEMIETYLQTLAKVVGSYEEAKKKMYACSTTTYQGFQCLVTEEESEKFRGLPGVVFILPDSYIDPVNKEYGGDKYDNGVITPRPPPVQYGRSGGRIDRSRDNRNGPRAPPGDGYRRDSMPMSNTPGGRGPVPSYQNEQRYNNPQSGSFPQGQRDIRGDTSNYGPPQGPGGNISQPAGNYAQGQGGNFPQGQSSFRGDRMNYGPPQGPGGNIGQPAGNYVQGPGVKFPQGQSNIRGEGVNYGPPPQESGGNIGPAGGSYVQGPGGSFSQGQSNIRGDSLNYSPPQGPGGNIGQSAGSYSQGPGGNLLQGQSHIRGDNMNYGPLPGAGGNIGQSAVNYVQGVRGRFPQGQTDLRGESRFGNPQGAGNYGHQVGRGDGQIAGGNFPQEQRGFRGDHMSYGHPQGPGAPTQSQVRSDYGQNYSGDGPDQRFQQAEQRNNMQGEAFPRTNQGRY